MAIKANFESYHKASVVDSSDTDQSMIFLDHDKHTGKLTLARSLDDRRGAVVHVVEDFQGSIPELTTPDVAKLFTPANLYAEILPWFRTTLTTHLDSGEEVDLVLQHSPDKITLNAFRAHTDLDRPEFK